MKFPESAHAHALLDGLRGVEIGGAAHNPFGLNTINADIRNDLVYHSEQERLTGEAMPIDVMLAPGEQYPWLDGTWDFVISSHVIEHFWNPVGAIREWLRVTRLYGYVYIICPQRDALPDDVGKPLSKLSTLAWRDTETGRASEPEWTDEHHHRWTCDTFIQMCVEQRWHVHDYLEVDDKVGNGFTVVLRKMPDDVGW